MPIWPRRGGGLCSYGPVVSYERLVQGKSGERGGIGEERKEMK